MSGGRSDTLVPQSQAVQQCKQLLVSQQQLLHRVVVHLRHAPRDYALWDEVFYPQQQLVLPAAAAGLAAVPIVLARVQSIGAASFAVLRIIAVATAAV
jgi:hypothetical protein